MIRCIIIFGVGDTLENLQNTTDGFETLVNKRSPLNPWLEPRDCFTLETKPN